jgi:hypothetical protein
MKKEILVDARWLEPPEPMERVLKALADADAGIRVRFLIHREPLPLYPLLSQMHCQHQIRLMEDGCYEILITRS